jgi:hypothetical protein
VDSQKDARDHDPERLALKERFAALAKYITPAGCEFTAAKVLQLGTEFGTQGRYKYPGLNEAFDCSKGSAKSIGKQLSRDLAASLVTIVLNSRVRAGPAMPIACARWLKREKKSRFEGLRVCGFLRVFP